MNQSYNLVKEPWIPIIERVGRRHAMESLEHVLVRAAAIRTIYADTPLQTAAIYRLLLAILQAALDISDHSWKTMWADRAFPHDRIVVYFQRWLGRFDLFDPDHPFYQDPNLATKPESVSSLSSHIASGDDATLFSHNTRDRPLSLSPAEATRAVLSIQCFGLAGTKGLGRAFTDAPCARGMVLLLEGESLFETLMLNLFERNLPPYRLQRNGRDRPAWEMDNPFMDDPDRPFGLLDHLTWQSRRIRLLPETDAGGGVCVRTMRYDIGLRTADVSRKSVRDVFNPMYYWRANVRKKAARTKAGSSHTPITFQREKALWRDSAVLLSVAQQGDEDADKPPAALVQAQNLAQKGILPSSQTLRLQALGACTKSGQDKTYFYRQEALPLPLRVLELDENSLIGDVASAVTAANGGRDALGKAASIMARLVLKPLIRESALADKPNSDEQKRITALASSWGVERYYWSALEPHFHRFIEDLPSRPEQAMQAWRNAVRREANRAFAQAESYAAGNQRSMRAVAVARQWFNMSMQQTLGKADSSPTGGENE